VGEVNHTIIMTRYTSYALLLIQLVGTNAFTVQSNNRSSPLPSSCARTQSHTQTSRNDARIETLLRAQKQSRSSLLKPPTISSSNKTQTQTPVKEEEVFGAKFFGGNAVKVDDIDDTIEAQADKLSALYPQKSQTATALPIIIPVLQDDDAEEEDDSSYRRFMDEDAFDLPCRSLAQRLQTAMNQALYATEDGEVVITSNQVYSPNLQWKTPIGRSKESKNPLEELTRSLDFYKRVDAAVISAKLDSDGGKVKGDGKVEKVQVRWEISLVWPNTWESRVLITGTSDLTVDMELGMILSQSDRLDKGGKEGKDAIQTIAPQIQPRFWDLYHIGMTPSAEIMPKLDASVKAGAFSKYDVFEIAPRLVLQPTVQDEGGRLARQAESLPNHVFSSLIITTGPKAQRYTATSPVEVAIRRQGDKSVIEWKVPVPAEFISYYDELTYGDDTVNLEDGNSCKYSYQPKRLVATLPHGGNAQDKEVSDIRKELYEQVTKDGLRPKLVEGRPQFFFLNNDAKACFTADGGLGMAVYEWRPAFVKSNEVGIELEM